MGNSTLVNLVKVVVLVGGIGPITVGAAAPAYRGVEALTDSNQYSYTIQQGADYEVGTCVFLAGTSQLVRTPEQSSNGNAAITVSIGSFVSFVARAEDFETYVGAVDGLRAELQTPAGAGDIGLGHNVTYPVASVGDRLSRDIWVTDSPFEAKVDGSTDDSPAIQAALDYAKSHGGGDVYAPPGRYACVEGIDLTFTSQIPITFRGANEATVLFRQGSVTDPVFTMTGTGVLDTYAELSNFMVDGMGVTTAGVRIIDCARFVMNKLKSLNSDVGIDGVGALIFQGFSCTTNGNGVGFRTRAGTATANLIQLYGHESRDNTIGYDLGDGEALEFFGCEAAANGLPGEDGTGGWVLRSTLGAGPGEGTVAWNTPYNELNKGAAYWIENAVNLMLSWKEPGFYNTEDGHCIRYASGAKIRASYIRNPKGAGASDILQVRAVNSIIVGGLVHLYDEVADNRVALGETTSAGSHALNTSDLFGITAAGHEVLLIDALRALGGSANDAVFGKYGTGGMQFSFFADGTTPLNMKPGNLIGLNGSTPVAKGTITGSSTDGTGFKNLMTYLAQRGDLTDGTTP